MKLNKRSDWQLWERNTITRWTEYPRYLQQLLTVNITIVWLRQSVQARHISSFIKETSLTKHYISRSLRKRSLDMCAQQRFRSDCAFAESSLDAFWIVKVAKFFHADNEDLIRLRRCAFWFESWLCAHIWRLVFSRCGSRDCLDSSFKGGNAVRMFCLLGLKEDPFTENPFYRREANKDRNSCPKVFWLVQMAANLYLIALMCEFLQVRNDIKDIKMWCASIINLITDKRLGTPELSILSINNRKVEAQ